MLDSSNKRAILFADISGSSALYRQAGNSSAKQLIDHFLQELKVLVSQSYGKVIKTIGDEIMVSFEDADVCLNVAVSMQQRAIHLLHKEQLNLSVGASFGEVISDQGDLFGEAVNDAAQITRLAKGGQILLSKALFSQLLPESKIIVREFDSITYKGDRDISQIYRVYWQNDEASNSETRLMSSQQVSQHLSDDLLQLEYRGKKIALVASQMPFIIGRDSERCDLQVERAPISREHCTLDFRRGKFVFIDHSTNGCYLTLNDKKEFYIRGEEYPIIESTQVSLGEPASCCEYDRLVFSYQN